MTQKAQPRLHGVITRWFPERGGGFATSDGTPYFVSRDDLPRGRKELPIGTTVTFTASLAPEPGHDHLRARSIRVEGIAAPAGRSCEGKTSYSSQPDALSGLQRLASKTGENTNKLHVYKCDRCDQYHVGHKHANRRMVRRTPWTSG